MRWGRIHLDSQIARSFIIFGVIAVITACSVSRASSADEAQKQAAQSYKDCIGDNRFIYRPTNRVIETTPILPADASSEFILKAPYDKDVTYYGKIVGKRGWPYKDEIRTFGGRDFISADRMSEKSKYVASGLASKDDTLLTFRVSEAAGGLWRSKTVYFYTCRGGDNPEIFSTIEQVVSSDQWSSIVVILATLLLYFLAAATLSTPGNRFASLDPVILTSGSDGKGSLAKFQILFFSVIVFALLSYVFVRTGQLSDLSETILMLLGIAAIGSTAAKATDAQRNKIDFENWSWLRSKKWIEQKGLYGERKASWADIITSDGEFDVYRYQSCIFSLIVGVALIVVGVNQLSSFSIPGTLLGVLGLSQVVYVTGKLVSKPALAEVNSSITTLRRLESEFRIAAAKHSPVALTANDPRLKVELENYRSAADLSAEMFASATGLTKPDNFTPSI